MYFFVLCRGTEKMIFTDTTYKYFANMPHKIRAAVAESKSDTPFFYQDEPFFEAYEALYKVWVKKISQKEVAQSLNIGRDKLKQWELSFSDYGTVGLLPQLSYVKVDPKLEKLVVLIKASRPHESASLALRLAQALEIPDASLELIRQIQRCYGYGQNMDKMDIRYFYTLQHILSSVVYHKEKKKQERLNLYPHTHMHMQPHTQPQPLHDKKKRAETFINFESDQFQHKVELFKTLSQCPKKRQVRSELRRFGVHPNRFYLLKQRYLLYGVRGLVDLVQNTKQGEKISPELELMIIEQRLMDPQLSTGKMIKKLDLKCSQANVQKIYNRWGLAKFKKQVVLRGVISQPPPGKEKIEQESVLSSSSSSDSDRKKSAKSLFPDLIQNDNLKVDRLFLDLLKSLSYRSVSISNPGAIIIAPFLDQLGVVQALHTYAPLTYRNTKMTNNIIVNTLRIIAGFPTINDFRLNSDRSVAIGAGLSLNPKKSRYYDSLDQLRFHHLQKLRNDASCRARELGIIEGKEIAVDYHCSPSHSRFPTDKLITKSPDKNQNMIYAHRPQIIWDSITNSIINIAYCQGSSRAPSALYKFCEENLFKIISPDAVAEIYADSEYTGEKQLLYLTIRSQSDITMCLKQNPKIKRWKEETIRKQQWQSYEDNYQIVSQDFILPETAKTFRFVVKRNIETKEVRCFGSTHADYSPAKILNLYHIRWPVESGLKDLVENYYLDKPTGTSPEKVEAHYYCVMLARMTIDYFLSVLGEQKWKGPQEWECVLATIRTSIFSNQNCQLSVNEDGDLEITFLDGDELGIINNMAQVMDKRKKMGTNKVSWWGNRAVRIKVKNQYKFLKADLKSPR
jgi:hypothetical protein